MTRDPAIVVEKIGCSWEKLRRIPILFNDLESSAVALGVFDNLIKFDIFKQNK